MPVLVYHGLERSIGLWFTVLLGSHLLSSLFITAVEQGSVPIQDPYELCRNPYQELKNLSLVGFELREYTKPVNQWHAGTPELVQRLFRHQLLLPETLLQRSISNLGELTRLENALQKLANGDPITVVGLGGSISAGHGVHDPENGWIARVFTWLEETFPDADHTLLNRAIPAVTSGYVSACVPELVPDNADLVLLEFTYNDHVFSGGNRNVNDASRRGLERLLRRLIVHPSRPGILYIHYWPAARYKSFYDNDEDLIDAVLKYYAIPTLSMRNALHGLLTQTPELIDQLWWPAPDLKIHPNCIGARMMADIVIGHLQHLTAGLQEQPPIATNAKLDALADRQPFHRQPFLFEGNWGHTHTACVLEQDLPALVDRVQGWQWLDEGKTRQQHKWGYISLDPGAQLDIQVPLDYVPASAGSRHFLVGVGGLISYQHMGSMELKCSGGCTCPALHHDMFHSQKFSMTGWRYLNVTRSGEQPCVVTAANSQETSTGEHKLKISSLMMSTLGEVVEGEERTMLSHAMTNLNSSKALETTSMTKARRRSYRNGDLSNWGTWPGGGRWRASTGQVDGVDEGGGTAKEQGPPGPSRRWRQQTEPAQQSSITGRNSRRSGAEVDGGSWVRLENKGGSRRSGETSGAAVRAWESK